MTKFNESNINFNFNGTGWEIVKYDEHLAHKKVSDVIHPTKAVDFLGIYNNQQLYFVEVKNYKGHTGDSQTREVLDNGGKELMHRIAVKVRDTIASATNSARFSTNDSHFFDQINKILTDDAVKVVVIAWIEFDELNEKERKAKMGIWQQELKRKLSWLHAAKISVNSIDNANDILPETEIAFA